MNMLHSPVFVSGETVLPSHMSKRSTCDELSTAGQSILEQQYATPILRLLLVRVGHYVMLHSDPRTSTRITR